MTVTIEEETDVSFTFDYKTLAKETISFALQHENFPYEAEVNLILTDDASIQEINKRYRNIDRPTDVLSFPMLSLAAAGDFSELSESLEDNFNPDTGEALLGDIVLSVPRVKEQAKAYGHSVRREFAFLIVHSALHLMGYDHELQEEAAFMEHKQKTILNEMNILR